jgi:hypothetical protein
MSKRREVLGLGLATALVLADRRKAFGAPVGAGMARLETRLFNLKPDLPAAATEAAVAGLNAQAAAAGLEGFMLGRNAIPQQFPTRFEWIYMAQWDPGGGASMEAARALFRRRQDDLAAICSDQAICDLNCALAPGFGAARGVKVRHTVMFSFKPEASPQDRLRNVNAIRAMGRLPMVQNYLVQQHMASAAGPDQMDWQVIGDFASLADYRAYSDAPAHLAIRDDFRTHTSRVAFLDVTP